MKKMLILALAVFCMTVGLEAQGLAGTKENKVLVAYFSWGGTTRIIADEIHKTAGGDLFEIQTVQKYPKAYRPTTDVAKQEQEEDARPALATRVSNMAAYDTIFVGYPLWWGTIPQALFTFFESYDFAGKTILPFCTFGSTGLGRSVDDIKKLSPGATVRDGLGIRSTNAKTSSNEVAAWLRKQGFGA
jgi:flavodoxin